MIKKKTIYSDTLLSFGKYKGRAVVDVLAEDPGYFLWLHEANMATLDLDVAEVVSSWAKAHPKEAKKTTLSAQRVKQESNSEDVKTPSSSFDRKESVSAEVQYTPKLDNHASNPNWGAW